MKFNWMMASAYFVLVGGTGIAAPSLTLSVVETFGPACDKPGDVAGTLRRGGVSENWAEFTYSMAFRELETETVPPEQNEAFKDCHVGLKVTPPRDYTFVVSGVSLRGQFDSPQGETTSSFTGSYTYQTSYITQRQGTIGDPESTFIGPSMNFEVQPNRALRTQSFANFAVQSSSGLGGDRGIFSIALAAEERPEPPCGKTMYVTSNNTLMASGLEPVRSAIAMTGRGNHMTLRFRLIKCEGH